MSAAGTPDPALLREALSLPPLQRDAWLQALATRDPAGAASLRQWLQSLQQPTAAGDAPAGAGPSMPAGTAAVAADRERVIGPYRLLRQLGQGAMGEVWLARQQHPDREVALKLLRGGPGSAELLARFVREANLLGRVEHPAIARVYAAGSEAGVPWLAMEYVDGETLSAWSLDPGHTRRQRLGLLLTLAKAVHHAHLRGVIHRDLKPENILVDAQGQPKILDFGVARALDEDSGGMTRHGELVGTLAYMSPEQLEADPARIDARTDVYALGAIAYELLGGQPLHRLDGRSLLEALRARERTPVRALGQVDATLRGDVEAVVMKALAASPEHRYASAAALADELEALLQDRPVQARVPGWRESLLRLLRRHRWAAAGVTLVLGSLLAATVFSLQAARQEAQARAEAESRTEVAEAVRVFLNDLFAAADPERGRGVDLTVRELLDEAGLTLARSPPTRPEVELALRELLARAYANLGEYAAAEGQYASALALLPPQAEAAVGIRLKLAGIDLDQGEVGEAEAALQALAEQLPRDSLQALELALQRARVPLVAGDPAAAAERAEALLAELADWPAAAAQAPPPGQPQQTSAQTDALASLRWSALQTLAVAEIQLGRFQQAETHLQQVIAAKSAALGSEHVEVLRNRSDLATVLDRLGRWQEAAALLREVHQAHQRLYGDDNLITAGTLQNLAKVLLEQGQLDQSGPMLAQIAPIIEQRLGSDHPQTLVLRGLRAYQFEEEGALAEAEAQYRAILDSHVRRSGPRVPEALIVRNNLARLLQRDAARASETRTLYAALLEDALQVLGAEHFVTAIVQGNYGEFLLDQGDVDAAGPLLKASLERLEAVLGSEHERVGKARARLTRWRGS